MAFTFSCIDNMGFYEWPFDSLLFLPHLTDKFSNGLKPPGSSLCLGIQ